MYNENMLLLISQIEKEERERRFKHLSRNAYRHPKPLNKWHFSLSRLIARLSERMSHLNPPTSNQKRATTELSGI